MTAYFFHPMDAGSVEPRAMLDAAKATLNGVRRKPFGETANMRSMISNFVKLNRACSYFLRDKFPSIFGATPKENELLRRIEASISELRPTRIIEVGGIDRPMLQKCFEYTYIGIDIEEKSACYEIYDEFYVQSIEKKLNQSAEIIFSRTLLEHVRNNAMAIESIAAALKEGGQTHHYIPSKWHPYSVGLRLVGPILQKRLIATLRPWAADVTGYPAYFDRCSIKEMWKLFSEFGLTDIETTPYYRANDYFAFFTPAYVLVSIFEIISEKLNAEVFAAGFVISGRKVAK